MFKKLIFILVPLILIGSHLGQRVRTWYQIQKEMADLEANIDRLEKEQQSLEAKKDFYQTEDFIRREAREKLGLIKKEDLVIILPDLPDLSDKGTSGHISPDSPTWKQWWDLFFINNS